MKSVTLALIRFYQACLSPAVPSCCRFHPSCSAYAYEAVEKWGIRQGVRMRTPGGRAVLKRRRQKGRHRLTP